MEINVSKNELYDLIKQAIKEVLQEESLEYGSTWISGVNVK